jgi:F-type H+-transporting ATPase subunit b
MLGFDVPTFVFQIINFLILLAIMARFFYRRILEVMQRRQELIDARIEDAERRAREADQERDKLARLSETARREAAALVEAARDEAAQERKRVLDAARMEAAAVIDAARRTAAAEEQAALARLTTRLSQSAVNIAGALIREASGETVHEALVSRLLSDDFGLDATGREQANLDFQRDRNRLVVESAYPLTPSQEQLLRQQAAQTLDRNVEDVKLEIHQAPELIAGIRLLMGAMVIDLSLRHLLQQLSQREDEA